jgi:methyl coenzyme M reductase beta subunit
MHILYSLILGVWGAVMAARKESISGNYWGAVAIATILAALVLALGLAMSAQGLRVSRTAVYFLYMAWLVIIMPGLYSMLRGRDDRSAAIAFSLLSFFNSATSTSMFQRGLIAPWLPE